MYVFPAGSARELAYVVTPCCDHVVNSPGLSSPFTIANKCFLKIISLDCVVFGVLVLLDSCLWTSVCSQVIALTP